MTGLQMFVGSFGLAALAVSILAVRRILKSPHMRYKPLWIVGCLFGFVGFGLNWSAPGDLFFVFGAQIPFVRVLWTAGNGAVVIKAMFPVVAIVALERSRAR
jgi:hypothetical protein